jgi:hypothetical protein
MRMKYEFEMPETPYENNCRVCPLIDSIDGYVYCSVQYMEAFPDYKYQALFRADRITGQTKRH